MKIRTWRKSIDIPYFATEGVCDRGTYRQISIQSGTRKKGSHLCYVLSDDTKRDWKKIIREGSNATTDLVAEVFNLVDYQPYYQTMPPTCKNSACRPVSGASNGVVVSGDYTNVTVWSSSYDAIVTTEADNLAREYLYKNILDKQRRFTGGVFVGELSKALKMIRNPAKSFFHSVLGTIRSLKKEARLLPVHKRRKFLEDTYLEATYGWAPLLTDVRRGAEALAEFSLRRGEYFVPVFGKSPPIVKRVNGNGSFGNSAAIPAYGALGIQTANTHDSEAQVRYYGKLRVDPYRDVNISAQTLGFNPGNWVPTAWELVPYSFLVDYFSNIGDVLNAWSVQISNLNWLSRTTVRRYRSRGVVRTTPNKPKPNGCLRVPGIGREGLVELERVRIDRVRSVIGSVSPPSFRFELPGYGRKWLNIGALASARLRRPIF